MALRDWLPFALLGVILLGEIGVWGRRRGGSTRRDRGSLWFIMILLSAGYSAAFRLRPPLAQAWSAWSLWLGAALTVAGTLFRRWSVGALGRYFTVTVQTSADQKVVEAGPYRLIRHPAYLGGLAAACGIGISLGGWACLLSIAGPMLLSYAYRIKVEEAALCEALGEPYRDYMRRTSRLIPFVF